MVRSNWGQKPGQEHILTVRIKRSGWDRVLSLAVLTSFEPDEGVYPVQADVGRRLGMET